MPMPINTKYRSKEREIMDDFEMEGELLRDTLDKLGRINKWLGGNRITLEGIKQLLSDCPKDRKYRIIDLGCGHGDLLRRVANYGRKQGYTFELMGLDANRDAIAYAEELSTGYPELSYKCMDIFSDEFKAEQYDLVLSTLFLHHFSEKEIAELLGNLTHSARVGIVVNDLHRNRMAYILFKILGLFISNKMIVEDGLTSILRSFKRKELEDYSERLQLDASIQWKWAFRYQWLIKT